MIQELFAKNFKSWPQLGPMRLAPLTGLFGTNSSGKSSVLQLLLMLKQTVESTDRAAVLEFGDSKSMANLGSFRDVVFGHQSSEHIEFSLNWQRPEPLEIADPQKKKEVLFSSDQMSFRAVIQENGSKKLAVRQLSYQLGDHMFTMEQKKSTSGTFVLQSKAANFKFTRSVGRAWDLPSPVKCYGFPDQVYAYFQNAGFLAELQLAYEELFKSVYYLGPLRDFPQRHYTWTGSDPADMGRRGERVVDAILASRERGATISPGHRKKKQTLEERVAYWLKQLGLIHDFAVAPIAEDSKLYHVKVQKSPRSPQVLITDVGFGVSQVLPVLVLCYYVPEGSIVLLEQPEIHLHPSVQSGLADVLIDVIKNRRLQIIVESHSEHLLRRMQLRIVEEVIRPDETALYFCNISDHGSQLTKLDINLFGEIDNWPRDFFGDEFGEMAAITNAAMKKREAQACHPG